MCWRRASFSFIHFLILLLSDDTMQLTETFTVSMAGSATDRATLPDDRGRLDGSPVSLSPDRTVPVQPKLSDDRRTARVSVVLFHRAIALVLLVLTLPILAVSWVLVRITSPGPGIFRQRRVGLHGRVFVMYKIRTMRCDAEAATGPVWALERDPRVTLIGRFLRATHFDEIPQLYNVLRGDMLLVGPRPERPEFTTRLAREIPGYMTRLTVRPGITGLAQVNLPPDTDLDSVRRKLALDLTYIAQSNLLLDFRIVLATCLRSVGLRSRRLRRMLGVAHAVPVTVAVDTCTNPRHASCGSGSRSPSLPR